MNHLHSMGVTFGSIPYPQLLHKNKYPLRGRDLFWICWEVHPVASACLRLSCYRYILSAALSADLGVVHTCSVRTRWSSATCLCTVRHDAADYQLLAVSHVQTLMQCIEVSWNVMLSGASANCAQGSASSSPM
jgi:hypothetical protein